MRPTSEKMKYGLACVSAALAFVAASRADAACRADRDCEGKLVCDNGQCVELSSVSTAPALPKNRAFAFALTVDDGLFGHLAYAKPGFTLGPMVAVPLGPFRYYAHIGFETVNGFFGARLEPFDLGLPITLATLPANGRIEIEPILINAFQLVGNGDGHDLIGSTTLGIQLTLMSKGTYVSLLPFGLEMLDFSRQGNASTSVIAPDFGANWFARGAVGVRF
jgi:hypothetical protein